MQVHLWALAAALATLGAFLLTYSRLRWRGNGPKLAWLLLLGLAAIPGLAFALQELGYALPGDANLWLHELRSREKSELLLIPLGGASGALAALLPAFLRAVFLLLAVATPLSWLAPSLAAPLPPGALLDRWNGDVCLQTSTATSGPASACTILKHFGITATEPDLARETFTSKHGTHPWELVRSLRRRGLEVTFHQTPGFDPAIPWPAIALLQGDTGPQFLPILREANGRFLLGDPLQGPLHLNQEQITPAYPFTGLFLSVRRTGGLTSP